jgi:hypothetical protein
MHTLMVTAMGFVSLFVFILVAFSINKRKPQTSVNGAGIFIWFWLTVSLWHFGAGVLVANYPVMTEIGVHIIVFGLPAGVAWYLSHRSKSIPG